MFPSPWERDLLSFSLGSGLLPSPWGAVYFLLPGEKVAKGLMRGDFSDFNAFDIDFPSP
ncbi:hypothetical protein [Rubinisphaera italica]|uniref:hypothetical protein n=1 Tax=Rubinisphaera italica TaxID=2527969 RepID=UPI0013EF347E|nr:hypothetical protein [Rubinisphaera italica]